jgi:YHS domain-containing protein
MIGWILRFILLMVVIRVIWKFLGGIIDGLSGDAYARSQGGQRSRRGGVGVGPGGPGGPGGAGAASVPLVRDPVCGTYVVRAKALTAGSGDQTQYFCSEKCRDEYRKA